jgi:predicted site-specific integrase-resolvase
MRSRNDEHPPQSGSAREPKSKSRTTLPRRVAIGYARVAAVSQRAPRAGLDAQARAKAEGITCVEVIEDSGESALNLKRPGLKRLFRALDAGPISVVITADPSRLARDMSDLRRLLSRFARRSVSLITVEGSHDTTTEGRRPAGNGGGDRHSSDASTAVGHSRK